MSPQADPQLGRVLGSQYRIDALLGQGGMGAVYRGVQLSVQRPVAIKLISASAANQAELLTRFRREAEATARLSHPNTVRLFDFGVTESREMYMVMELLDGCDLSVRLAQGPIQLAEALFIVREVLQALSEAHALGIVHRDLKPANVFLAKVHGGESVVKVMDFGIAGLEQSSDGQKLTITGAVMGTPAYMSPEQAQGKAVDARCDLYSIGVMLFEMLTGRPPFDANTLVSILLAHVTQPPKRLEEAGVQLPNHDSLQELLDRLLAKQPAARPPSAAHALEVVEALLVRCQGDASAMVRPTSFPQTARFVAPPDDPPAVAPRATAIGSVQPAAPAAPVVAHTVPQRTPVGWDVTASAAPRAKKARSNAWLIGGLAAGGALAVFALAPSKPAEPIARVTAIQEDPQPSAAAAPEQPKPHRVLIETTPKGAAVLRAGQELGRTPFSLGVRGADDVELSLPGHVAQRVRVTRDSPSRLAIALEAVAARVDDAPGPAPAVAKDDSQASVKPERPSHHRPGTRPTKPRSAKASKQPPEPQGVDEPGPAAPAIAQASATGTRAPDADADRARRTALLRRAPPFASLAAAQRAYSAGKINATALEDAVWVLKTRRNERIEIEKENLKRGAISAREYEWRLGRIDAELRGD